MSDDKYADHDSAQQKDMDREVEEALDLWADDMEPVVGYHATVYRLALSDEMRMKYRTNRPPVVYASVEEGGLLTVEDHSWFNGKTFRNMDWEERRDLYDWLVEWEYAQWQRIGPEDSELFSTDKLTQGD